MERRPSNLKAFTKEIVEPVARAPRKIHRYRAGKVPDFHQDSDPEESESHQRLENAVQVAKNERERFKAKIVTRNDVQSQQKAESDNKKDLPQTISAISDSDSDSDSNTSNNEFDRRRAALKEKLQQQTRNDRDSEPFEAVGDTHESEHATSASSSSEYESTAESDSEEMNLLKPMFVPKTARKSLSTQEIAEINRIEREKLEAEKVEARKLVAKKLVAEELQQVEIKNEDGEEIDMPSDTDGVSPDEEYRAWEIRELKRIKRNRDKAVLWEMEQKETERRRNMTVEEREAEDRKLKKNLPKEKKKWKYLQKYYHKGAFYVDESSIQATEDVRKRDASGATLEDKFDKELLPKVMQVKNFGRAGRTKYTHLVDQDTTGRDSLWSKSDEIRAKYSKRMGGVRDLDNHSIKKRKT